MNCFGACPLPEVVNDYNTLLFGGQDQYRTIWTGGSAGIGYGYQSLPILIFLQTPSVNRSQRWLGRMLYSLNPIAQSAVNNSVELMIGEGFTLKAKSKYWDAELQIWLKKNKMEQRIREAVQRFFVDGEVFFWTQKDKVRFIEPDYVFDAKNNGVNTDPYDIEDVISYNLTNNPYNKDIHLNKVIPAKQVVHWKNSWITEKRGFSFLFSCAETIISAQELLKNLGNNVKVLSKIGAVRTWENEKRDVSRVLSDLKSNNTTACNENENIEDIQAGTIYNQPNTAKMEFPASTIDATKYLAVYQALLRSIAGRFQIAEATLSQDNSALGAYNGQVVSHAHITRGLEAKQQMIKNMLVELCAKSGFPEEEIQVIVPETAVLDKNEQVAVADFLLSRELASPQTCAKILDIDYDEELPMIKKYSKEINKEEVNNANSREGRNDSK